MHYWMIRWGNLWGMRETRPADVIDQMRLHQRVSLPWPLDLQRAAPWPRVRSCSSGIVSPPPLDTLEESWGELDLLRFWFFLLLAALTDRRSTSLALKKATMNGCFDWGPCRPTRPADFTLMLWPGAEEGALGLSRRDEVSSAGLWEEVKVWRHYQDV